MKKMMHWVLAATLICGASMFTSCSVNDDNSSKTANENRKEFIKHKLRQVTSKRHLSCKEIRFAIKLRTFFYLVGVVMQKTFIGNSLKNNKSYLLVNYLLVTFCIFAQY